MKRSEKARRPTPEEASRITREVTARAIRRLSMLEALIMGTAVVLALGAGAVLARMGQATFGWPFRPTWAAVSLTLFIVPATVAWWREKRSGP